MGVAVGVTAAVIDAWTALCAVAVLASGGSMAEPAAGELGEHALKRNSAIVINKHGVVCIGAQFITVR